MTPAILIATWFGSGLLKPAPGTWGTLAGLPFAFAIAWYGAPWWLLPSALLLFPVGVWAANAYDRANATHDASEIVVDEVVGVWLTLCFVPPDWLHYLVGFLLFRLFDILKPWPVRWADRQVSGGLGVMLDDVLAAGYAAAALYLLGLLSIWSTTL